MHWRRQIPVVLISVLVGATLSDIIVDAYGYKDYSNLKRYVKISKTDINNTMDIRDKLTYLNEKVKNFNGEVDKLIVNLTDVDKLSNERIEEISRRIKLMETGQEGKVTLYYDINDVTKPSYVDVEFIRERLKGTGLEGLEEAYIKAEQMYGINAIVLIGMSSLESAFGTSRIAEEKNNLFGFMAYDSSPYESAMVFESREDCILKVAKYLAENYMLEGGKYYSGKSVYDINKWKDGSSKWATDEDWADKVVKLMNEFVNKGLLDEIEKENILKMESKQNEELIQEIK